MVPFLDPGSRFFEEPAQHGYRIFQGEHGVLPPAFCRAIRVTIDATVPRQMIEDCLASRPRPASVAAT
jgi:hypothetical protein